MRQMTLKTEGNTHIVVMRRFAASPEMVSRAHAEPKPRMIVCDTRMCRGVPFLEAREKNHFIRVEEHEWQLALDALKAGRTT